MSVEQAALALQNQLKALLQELAGLTAELDACKQESDDLADKLAKAD